MARLVPHMSAEDYHADAFDDDRPALSGSIAHVLCTRSPLHAWAAHPKLNPEFSRVEEKKFDIGTAAHALMLEGQDAIGVVNADSWRTNAAKEARESFRDRGRIPLLYEDAQNVRVMAYRLREQLERFEVDPPLFTDGTPERTIVWEEDGVLCKARLDWLRDDLTAVDDYKTTSASASPSAWQRTLYSTGADVKAAFYLRGLAQVYPGCLAVHAKVFRWVVQETKQPYAASVLTLAESAWTLAEEKVQFAIDLWRNCLANDRWPSYPDRMAYVEAPSWEMMRWLEQGE